VELLCIKYLLYLIIMSVWKFPCYRDDALEAIVRAIHPSIVLESALLDTAKFVIEDFGNFPVVAGLKPGMLYEQLKNNSVKLQDLYVCQRKPPDKDDLIMKRFTSLTKVRFGLKEVYRLGRKFLETDWQQVVTTNAERSLVTNLFMLGLLGSYHGPKASYDHIKAILPNMLKELEKEDSARRFVAHLKAVTVSRRYNKKLEKEIDLYDEIPDYKMPAKVKNIFKNYDVFPYHGLTFLSNDDWYTATVFTKKDLDRLYQFTRGLTLYKVGLEQYRNTGTFATGKTLYAIFLASVKDCKRPNDLCRGWDLVANLVLARIATDVNHGAETLLKNKFMLEKHYEYINLNYTLDTIEKCKLRERLDIVNIYKALPCPDYDYFGAMNRQLEMYKISNLVANDDKMRELITYYKYMMVRAFRKKHGYLPGMVRNDVPKQEWHSYYPKITIKGMDYKFVDDLDLKGAFDYKYVNIDIMKHVKDAAINPKEILKDGYALNRLHVKKKNMLLDVFNREVDIDVSQIKYDTAYIDVKAEDKAEAKKPNGRMFFEANTDIRLKHSEYEWNLSTYIKHMPGCAIGLKKREMINKMNATTETKLDFLGEKNLFISFDIEKFSPHYDSRVHEALDNVNAYLFGLPDLRDAYAIHTKGDIIYYKKSVAHMFPKPKADLEGMSGKFNTAYHACVMGLAVNELRKQEIITTGADLATFIDDGLLKVSINSDTFKETAEKVVSLIDSVYLSYGLKLSFDKTLISGDICVFLHRVFFRGRELTSSLKAIMKMDNFSDKPASHMIDDLAHLESTARAALAAGSSHIHVYVYYCYLVMDTLRKWNKDDTLLPQNTVVWCFAPVTLGGLGVRIVSALCSSLAVDIQQDWLGIVFQIKRTNKVFNHDINNIINQPKKVKEVIDKLYGATTVKIVGQTVNPFRFKKAAEIFIYNLVSSHFRDNLFRLECDMMSAHGRNLSNGTVPVMVINRVMNASVDIRLTYLANKFLRSRTAAKLIGVRNYVRISYANHNDAVRWFKKLVSFAK
jgi:hypothetical protein